MSNRANRPSSPVRRQIQATVIALHGTDCAACGRATIVGGSPRDGRTFQLGHVIADAKGGEWKVSNFLPICRRCNAWMADNNWQDVAPMLRTPVDAPLLPDPGTSETHMSPPPWA